MTRIVRDPAARGAHSGAADEAAPPCAPVRGRVAGQAGRAALSALPAPLTPAAAAAMSEDGRRVLAYHVRDSRKSAEGFPDWTLCGPGGVAFWELKTQRGRVTAAQQEWLDALTAAGMVAVVRRPSDLLSGDMALELAVLAGLGASR